MIKSSSNNVSMSVFDCFGYSLRMPHLRNIYFVESFNQIESLLYYNEFQSLAAKTKVDARFREARKTGGSS